MEFLSLELLAKWKTKYLLTLGKMNSLGGAEYKIPDSQLKSENKIRGIHGCVAVVVLMTTFNQQNQFLVSVSSRCLYVLPGWLGTSSEENSSALSLTWFIFPSKHRKTDWVNYTLTKPPSSSIFPLGLPAKTSKNSATWPQFFGLIHSTLAVSSPGHTVVCTKCCIQTICFRIM